LTWAIAIPNYASTEDAPDSQQILLNDPEFLAILNDIKKTTIKS
jgi:hypothetical protein